MRFGTTAGWKCHILEGEEALCGKDPAWGWGFVFEEQAVFKVRAGVICGNCLRVRKANTRV